MQTILTAPTLKNCVRFLPHCRMSFVLTSKETNDAISIIDMKMAPGAEPPRHVHQWEDEIFILQKGTISFFVGEEIINAKEGTTVFMPRGVPHHFVITSPTAHCTLITTPGGMENYFEEISLPHEFTDDAPKTPDEISIQAMLACAARYGISFV